MLAEPALTSKSMPVAVPIDPPFAVKAPETVSRLTPLPALPLELSVEKVTPPLKVTDVASTAAPPVAEIELPVPGILKIPLLLATKPAPASVVTERLEKLKVDDAFVCRSS